MLSFYPGPSKVHPEALGYIQEAFEQGIVSMNHRSKQFEKLLEATTIINTDKRDEVLETITSAIDEVYDLLDKEQK
jgi:phosphoserine aminotransferase